VKPLVSQIGLRVIKGSEYLKLYGKCFSDYSPSFQVL
jgi:hypothetical protein